MNGPFGYNGNSLPYKLEMPNSPDVLYNSKLFNAPAYNEKTFLDISGYSYSGFGLDNDVVGGTGGSGK